MKKLLLLLMIPVVAFSSDNHNKKQNEEVTTGDLILGGTILGTAGIATIGACKVAAPFVIATTGSIVTSSMALGASIVTSSAALVGTCSPVAIPIVAGVTTLKLVHVGYDYLTSPAEEEIAKSKVNIAMYHAQASMYDAQTEVNKTHKVLYCQRS